MNLIELVDVVKVYRQGGVWGGGRRVRAVDGVSLSLAGGRTVALAGASGSGKSTLGRLVLGLEHPDAGRVLYRGREFRSLRGGEWCEARRDVQVVFQNSHGAVNPRFCAREVVGEPLRNFDGLRGGGLEERVVELLCLVGLGPEVMGKYPHQFSGGELQRICLARALASRPGLVVLDEAVGSLDMVTQSRMLGLIRRVGRETGTGFLFISHDLRAVCAVADSLVVMERGRVACVVSDLGDMDASMSAVSALGCLAASVLPPLPLGGACSG